MSLVVVAHNPVIQAVDHALAAFDAADDAIQARGRITEADIWRLCDRRDVLQDRVRAARASGLVGEDEIQRIEGIAAETLERIERRVAQRTNAEMLSLSRIMPNPVTQAFYQALIAFNGADEAMQARGQITEADIWTLRHRRDDLQERVREAREAGVDEGMLQRMAAAMTETRERIERRSAQMRNAQIVALPPGAEAPLPAILHFDLVKTDLIASFLPPEDQLAYIRGVKAQKVEFNLNKELPFGHQASDAILRDLTQFRALKVLNLNYVNDFCGARTCTATALIPIIRNNPSLLHLHLNCFAVNDPLLCTVGQRCPKLETLNIGGANGRNAYSPAGLGAVLQGCPGLKELNLEWFFRIEKEFIDMVAKYGKNLESLNLENTGQDSSYWEGPHTVDIWELAKGCPKLRTLKLYSACKGMRDDSILAALGAYCHDLRNLRMTARKGITDYGIGKLAAGCPHLERLDINSCHQITDKSLFMLAENCHGLEDLDISDADKVTEAGLEAVLKACPRCRLHIGYRESTVSDQTFEALLAKYPNRISRF